MDEKYLIKNTTREQREKIIRDALSCNGVSCEECSACDAYGAVNPLEMYQPYIDGKNPGDQPGICGELPQIGPEGFRRGREAAFLPPRRESGPAPGCNMIRDSS